MAEAFLHGDLLVVLEGVGMDVADHREMLRAGAQVLTEGEDGDAVLKEVVHGLEELVFFFAEAEHEAALGGDFAAELDGHFLGAFQDVEAARIHGAAAHERGEALHGFEVVIEDVGLGLEHGEEGVVLAVEVGHEDLDGDAGLGGAHGFDGLCEVIRATVHDVVTSDGGDDDVVQLHALHGLGHALGFVRFERERFGGLDGAKATGAGAAVARDHEGRGALAPAFPTVRALSFLADGVQFEIGDEGLGAPEHGIARQFHADPVGFLVRVQGGVDLRSHGKGS